MKKSRIRLPVHGLEHETPEKNSHGVGMRVRHYRERMGLSQEELATRVGATQQTIQSLEAGKIRKSTFLPHIARELGVDFEVLAFGGNLPQSGLRTRPILTANTRRVPLFNTRDIEPIRAYLMDQSVPSPSGKWVAIDYSQPFADSGPRLLALKLGLSDEAFQPEFRPGDQLVVDPDAPIEPADPVVIHPAGEDRLRVAKYRVASQSGYEIDYELVSLHPDFPGYSGAELKSVTILGVVIQMRRPVARRVRLAVLEKLGHGR